MLRVIRNTTGNDTTHCYILRP